METLLGSIPSPSSGNLGPFHMYGLILAVGVLVAVWFAEHRWRARGYPRDMSFPGYTRLLLERAR